MSFSFSFSFRVLLLSHPLIFVIASDRRTRATPIAVRSSKFFAAGVSIPGFSDFLTAGVRGVRGVHDGGPISPVLRGPEENILDDDDRRTPPPRSVALAFRLFDASLASLSDSVSRLDGLGRWKGVPGSSRESSEDKIRGVALRVPHVINCLMAAGPSSSGLGVGTAGSSVVFEGSVRGRSVTEFNGTSQYSVHWE